MTITNTTSKKKLNEELKKLKQENEYLKMVIDILQRKSNFYVTFTDREDDSFEDRRWE